MKKLSVIMTTFNEDVTHLKRCIGSVLKQLFPDLEFIVVIEPDEPNTGFLEEAAKTDSRIRIIRNPARLGLSESRNIGIRKSSGKYIALIDSDDFCHIERFERQVGFLESHPEVNVVGSAMFLVDNDNRILGSRDYSEYHNEIQRKFLLTMGVANPTVMFRKRDIDEIGLFNKRFIKAEDFEIGKKELGIV